MTEDEFEPLPWDELAQSQEIVRKQELYIIRLRAALRTLGWTTEEIQAIVHDADKEPL